MKTIPIQTKEGTRYLIAEMVERLNTAEIAINVSFAASGQIEALMQHFYPNLTGYKIRCPYMLMDDFNGFVGLKQADVLPTDLPAYPISAFFAPEEHSSFETFIATINNVEWDGVGNPLYYHGQMQQAYDAGTAALHEQVRVLREALRDSNEALQLFAVDDYHYHEFDKPNTIAAIDKATAALELTKPST